MHGRKHPPIPLEILMLAYRSGIFPMADARDDSEVFWVEPRERAILPLDGFRLSSSLRKIVRQDRYRVTVDAAFAEVIEACATPRSRHDGSWISHRIEASYRDLFAAGHAHSVECWDGVRLVGGLYGVTFDRVFCGESMFSRADNASKVALAWLVAIMRRADYRLLDCQFITPHLASLGAVEIAQARYLELVAEAEGSPAMSLPQAYAAVSSASSAGAAGSGGAVGGGVAAGAGRAGAGSSSLSSDAPRSSPGKLIAQSLTQTS